MQPNRKLAICLFILLPLNCVTLVKQLNPTQHRLKHVCLQVNRDSCWVREVDDMETELISSISLHWVSSPHDNVQISKASRRFCLKLLSWVRWEPMWFADRDAVMVTCHVCGVVAHFFINMDINFSIEVVLLWKPNRLESQ